MTMRKLWWLAAFCWLGVAAAEIAVPPLTARITDQTATLSAAQQAALEQTLQAFEVRKGSQLAVLIVATTAPETIEQYALRVAEQWKLGRKQVDDGAILVIAKDDRALRLEVGYGLEGALNDATSKRILSETITPAFKQGDYAGGITAGVAQIIQVIDGEPLPAPATRPAGDVAGLQKFMSLIFVVALVSGGLTRAMLGRVPGAVVTGGVVALVAWLLVGALSMALLAGVMALVFTLLTGGLGGGRGFGGMAAGGLRGGLGGGRGGFGGGGGGFGGGGASGRW